VTDEQQATTIVETNKKLVVEAAGVLEKAKIKWSEYETIEIPLNDPNNTIIVLPRIKYEKCGLDFILKKYIKVLKLNSDINGSINRHIARFIS
jgi:hypothetical protein